MREALLGNAAEARRNAAGAQSFSRGKDAQYGAALAFAFAGDLARAEALTKDLEQRYPEDTIVRFSFVPTRGDCCDPARRAGAGAGVACARYALPVGMAVSAQWASWVRYTRSMCAGRLTWRCIEERKRLRSFKGLLITAGLSVRIRSLCLHTGRGAKLWQWRARV